MREFSHTCKSLTVKCCARFRHNIYFSSESSGLAAVITGRPNAPGETDTGETDTGLAAGAASRTIARPDLPAPSGPILPDTLTRVLTSRARRRPTSGQARKWVISTHGGKRTIRASADGRSASRDADPIPTADHAPPCPCAAGPGNGAAHRRAAIPDFLLDRSADAE